MNKQELLKFVNDLPEDAFIEFVYIRESSYNPWRMTGEHSSLGPTYQRYVNNELTLKLSFKTSYESQFKRDYLDPEGRFYNIKRVN